MPDIYYECQLLASISEEIIVQVKELNKNSELNPNSVNSHLFKSYEPGNDLAENLQFLLANTYISQMFLDLIVGYNQDNSDNTNSVGYNNVFQKLEKQSEWLLNRLKPEIENDHLKR